MEEWNLRGESGGLGKVRGKMRGGEGGGLVNEGRKIIIDRVVWWGIWYGEGVKGGGGGN
jgi:hypothetical protein